MNIKTVQSQNTNEIQNKKLEDTEALARIIEDLSTEQKEKIYYVAMGVSLAGEQNTPTGRAAG